MNHAKFERYGAYKYSDFEWLGEVPNHWNIRRLKDISKLIVDGTHFTPDYTDHGVHFLSVTDITRKPFNIQKSKFISYDAHRELIKRCYPKKGDILLSKNGTIGVPFVIDFDNEVSIYVSLCLIKLFTITNNRYSYYSFLSSFMFEQYNLHSKMTSVTNLHLDKLKNFYQLSPSLPEQQAIADYLDTKTAQIDRKIDLLTQKATQYAKLKQSLINETVTHGLDKTVAMKDSGVEWIGEVPEHWRVTRIKDITLVKRGASPRPIDNPIYFDEEGEFSWVRIADLSASERYLLCTKEKLSALGASLSVKRYSGDFILSIAGTVGKPIITKIKCCIHDGFVWFPDLKVNPEFLYYCFSTGMPYQGLGKLGTQLNLNTETVGLISLPMSSDDELNNIICYLDTKTAHINRIIETINTQIDKLKELRKTLINDVVTGKIKVA